MELSAGPGVRQVMGGGGAGTDAGVATPRPTSDFGRTVAVRGGPGPAHGLCRSARTATALSATLEDGAAAAAAALVG